MVRRDATHLAVFEPFMEGEPGARTYANRLSTGPFRQRDAKPFFQKRRRHWTKLKTTIYGNRINTGITRASRLMAARKWIPCNPLLVHLMAMEDARLCRHGGSSLACKWDS